MKTHCLLIIAEVCPNQHITVSRKSLRLVPLQRVKGVEPSCHIPRGGDEISNGLVMISRSTALSTRILHSPRRLRPRYSRHLIRMSRILPMQHKRCKFPHQVGWGIPDVDLVAVRDRNISGHIFHELEEREDSYRRDSLAIRAELSSLNRRFEVDMM